MDMPTKLALTACMILFICKSISSYRKKDDNIEFATALAGVSSFMYLIFYALYTIWTY